MCVEWNETCVENYEIIRIWYYVIKFIVDTRTI